MYVYSDEDNGPMIEDFPIEYTGITGIINDSLFKQTGECVVVKTRKDDQ